MVIFISANANKDARLARRSGGTRKPEQLKFHLPLRIGNSLFARCRCLRHTHFLPSGALIS